jgi:hypothetical protein
MSKDPLAESGIIQGQRVLEVSPVTSRRKIMFRLHVALSVQVILDWRGSIGRRGRRRAA